MFKKIWRFAGVFCIFSLMSVQTACYSSKTREANNSFIKKYGKEVEKITVRRDKEVDKPKDPEDFLSRTSAKKFDTIRKILENTGKGRSELTPTEIYQDKAQEIVFEEDSRLEGTIKALRKRRL